MTPILLTLLGCGDGLPSPDIHVSEAIADDWESDVRMYEDHTYVTIALKNPPRAGEGKFTAIIRRTDPDVKYVDYLVACTQTVHPDNLTIGTYERWERENSAKIDRPRGQVHRISCNIGHKSSTQVSETTNLWLIPGPR